MAYALLQTVVTHPKQFVSIFVYLVFLYRQNVSGFLIFFCNGSPPWTCLLYTNSILFVLTQSVSFVKMYCILILFFKKMYWEESIVCSARKKIMNVCMCTVDLFVYYVNRKQIFVLYV